MGAVLREPAKGRGHEVQAPAQGDSVVDGRWTFEIGGEGRKFGQIKDIPDSHVVNDGIELGYGNKIPLWQSGFLC